MLIPGVSTLKAMPKTAEACSLQRTCATGLFLLICDLMQAFIERSNTLVTCSKDGYVRVWDLGTQHCYQILLGQQGEVSACAQQCASPVCK